VTGNAQRHEHVRSRWRCVDDSRICKRSRSWRSLTLVDGPEPGGRGGRTEGVLRRLAVGRAVQTVSSAKRAGPDPVGQPPDVARDESENGRGKRRRQCPGQPVSPAVRADSRAAYGAGATQRRAPRSVAGKVDFRCQAGPQSTRTYGQPPGGPARQT
jgi:hypothetical protein